MAKAKTPAKKSAPKAASKTSPKANGSAAAPFDVSGFDKETLLDWYRTQELGRRLDIKAANYLKMAMGWYVIWRVCSVLTACCNKNSANEVVVISTSSSNSG